MFSKINNYPSTFTFHSISSSHLNFLKVSALLPPNNKSFSHPLSRLIQIWDYFVTFTYNIMWTGFIIHEVQNNDVELDEICEQIVVQSFCLRYILLGMKRNQFCGVIESCEKLWGYLETGEDIIVRQFERKAYYFRNLMLANLWIMAMLFVITAHFVKLPPLEPNGTERSVLPFRFFMDIESESTFNAVYSLQIVVCFYICIIIVGADTVWLFIIMMACGYFRSIRYRLLHYKGCEGDTKDTGEESFKIILNCARYHQQTLLFCEDIDYMTRGIFLFACLCPIYNLSMTGIKLLDNDENMFKFVALLFYNLFQFFICQWAPEHLMVESELIAEAAYFASLQPQAPSHREKINRMLYFIIMRAHKPVQLTAGGYIRLSFETFGVMLKSACSFFMVLRKFRS